MKRALLAVIALIGLMLFVLSGCGGDEATPAPQSTPQATRKPRPTPLPTPVAMPTPDCIGAFFGETKHTVCEPFLTYWKEKGSLAIFGYPITDLIQETDKATGEVYTAQYFERARFELHQSTGNTVVLGRLGALLQPAQRPVAQLEGATFFPETGHNLSGPFLKFWAENGGLAVFGYPITEERVETNPADKKDYTVQYFERSRFEYHPENARTPFEVQLGQLGTQLYYTKYFRR
ncbi:MAG TPA: hypothetical protein VEX13_12995 [Chloroflexia bacterium]|nr:hypothetical protein [Chloroflexia bacterium]